MGESPYLRMLKNEIISSDLYYLHDLDVLRAILRQRTSISCLFWHALSIGVSDPLTYSPHEIPHVPLLRLEIGRLCRV